MSEFDPPQALTSDDQILAVHEVLDRFAELEPAKAELVKLRYFAGLTLDQPPKS